MRNLGCELSEFKNIWRNNYLSHKGQCSHHDERFEEGWIPLDCVPFSPVLKRFFGKSELAKEIVDILNKEGKYIFEKQRYFGIEDLEGPLEEIMFNIPLEIGWAIADYGANPFMLDKQAFGIDGEKNPMYIQWYIKEK